jgi:hypothetical protein
MADAKDKPKKLTFWQKLKQLTITITAIAALIAALGGQGFFVWNKTDEQDKVQESTYNLLAQRMEEVIKENATLKENVRHLEKDVDRLYAERHIEKPLREPVPEAMGAGIGLEDEAMVEMFVESEGDDEVEEAPPQIKLRGVARLPEFKNIQQVVSHTDKVIPLQTD